MSEYKKMYMLLFNEIYEISNSMQDTALTMEQESQRLMVERHIIALRSLQQQAEEIYISQDSEGNQ